MKQKQKISFQVVDRKRFKWTLVGVASRLLVISVAAAWGYYQSILRSRPNIVPADNQTIQTLQNATNNFTIGR